jgi:hypothetical protein
MIRAVLWVLSLSLTVGGVVALACAVRAPAGREILCVFAGCLAALFVL